VVIRVSDPMAYNSNILLGRITKISGYEGAVAVKLEKTFTENIPRLESVFLEVDGKPVPFLISESEYSGADILKLKFEDYETIEKVAEFVNCLVFLTSVPTNINIADDISDMIGYRVLSVNNTFIGIVTDLIQNPGQLLLVINSEANKEILIPLHEDFIDSIDDKEKRLVLDIPEGLIDLN
jgi:16S rRNA processing protein RimM